MPFDKLIYPEELWKERRKMVAHSLRTMTLDELMSVKAEHEEEFRGTPWRDEFLRLMAEPPHATFFHAIPQKDAEVYYCHDADFGFWVLPHCGIGGLDATAKNLMKEAIANHLSGGKTEAKR